MSIATACPHCAYQGTAPDAAAGRTVRCPGCQKPFAVPAALNGQPAPAAQPEPIQLELDRPSPRPTGRREVLAVAWWICLGIEGILAVVLFALGVSGDVFGSNVADYAAACFHRLGILGLMFVAFVAARAIDGALRD